MTLSIVCAGAAVLDYQFGIEALPTDEGKIFAQSYREVGGGPAATAAVAIARLGGKASLFSRVGDDDVGARICADLNAEGVETSGILRRPGQSTVSAVLVERSGKRVIANYRDSSLSRSPSGLPLDQVDGADAVLVDLRWPEASAAVLARAGSIPRIVDADATDDDGMVDILKLASHVIFSRPGLANLSGEGELANGLAAMKKMTGAFVAVTDGEDGYFWLDGNEFCSASAFQVDTVDTTGAGDVFHGAFAFALAGGSSEVEALRYASGAAALKCTKPGGREGIPTADELADFLTKRAA